MPKLANFQVVSGILVRPPSSESRVKCAWICGDVIGVGNSWREVPEIAEPGSNVSDHACGDGVLNRAPGIVLLATTVGTEETHSLRDRNTALPAGSRSGGRGSTLGELDGFVDRAALAPIQGGQLDA